MDYKAGEIKNVDVVIGIVGNWNEKIAFILNCVKNGQNVLLLFSAFQGPKNTIHSEYGKVKAFRERMQVYCLLLTLETDMPSVLQFTSN